jgi:hypothetical protein
MPTGKRSGLLTRIAATESVTLLCADEKLTAFLELESAICTCGDFCVDKLAKFLSPSASIEDLNPG